MRIVPDGWVERAKQLFSAGLGIKIALLFGGPAIVTFLAFLWQGLIWPAIHTIFYIIAHSGKIFG